MISINGMISIRARFFGMGEANRMLANQYDAPAIVKVMGIFTFETVPGRNRQRLNALRAELSKIGLPML